MVALAAAPNIATINYLTICNDVVLKKFLKRNTSTSIRAQRYQMKLTVIHAIALVTASVSLAACQATGENLRSDVYSSGQVNSAQQAQVISILAVMPAKIQVDNAQQKQVAQTLGAIIGAGAGGYLGSKLHPVAYGATLGVVGGGAAGAAAGSLVPDSVLVEGVSVTYEDQGRTLNSAQVGRSCEFKPGRAVMISTAANETRIQPNAECPTQQKG